MGSERLTSRLTSIFSKDRFKDDPHTLFQYGASLSGSTVIPCAVVYPVNTGEVSSLLKIANEEKLPVYPVSRGKNFGYGEAQGTDSGQLIVDFSRMDEILEVNEPLGYATIQPGVSQEKLFRHLEETASRLQLDVTGAGLDASIVGNVLERGFGHTDYGDRFARVVRLTAVTAEGEIIRTGFGSMPGASPVNTYRYGIGPVLDGLFSQSNFAIVTEMTIELMPKPDRSCMFVISAKHESSIGDLIEAVRELKLAGVVNSAVHFANKARAIGSGENRLAGFWNISGSISGPKELISARKRVVRKLIRKHVSGYSIWFFDDFLMNLVSFIHRKILPISLYAPLKDAWDLQKGIPTDHPLRILMNDESVSSSTIDPGGYSTCFLWINAVCAAERSGVADILSICKDEFSREGYEFRVTFTAVNPRSLIMITNINFERNEAAIEKATAFSTRLYKRLIEAGFPPYRSGSGSFYKMPAVPEETTNLLKRIKSAMDPNGVLAPGKYRIS